MNEERRLRIEHELGKIEPDFDFLATFGEELIPVIQTYAQSEDEVLVMRGVALAGMIDSQEVRQVIIEAASDARAVVRVSAMAACRMAKNLNLIEAVRVCLNDSDESVRRWALKTAAIRGEQALMGEIRALLGENQPSFIRQQAEASVKSLS